LILRIRFTRAPLRASRKAGPALLPQPCKDVISESEQAVHIYVLADGVVHSTRIAAMLCEAWFFM